MQVLKEYLGKKGLSQAAFAKMLNVSQPTVCDWVNGHMHPSTGKLIEISRATGIRIERLVADIGKAS